MVEDPSDVDGLNVHSGWAPAGCKKTDLELGVCSSSMLLGQLMTISFLMVCDMVEFLVFWEYKEFGVGTGSLLMFGTYSKFMELNEFEREGPLTDFKIFSLFV